MEGNVKKGIVVNAEEYLGRLDRVLGAVSILVESGVVSKDDIEVVRKNVRAAVMDANALVAAWVLGETLDIVTKVIEDVVRIVCNTKKEEK